MKKKEKKKRSNVIMLCCLELGACLSEKKMSVKKGTKANKVLEGFGVYITPEEEAIDNMNGRNAIDISTLLLLENVLFCD